MCVCINPKRIWKLRILRETQFPAIMRFIQVQSINVNLFYSLHSYAEMHVFAILYLQRWQIQPGIKIDGFI